LQAAGQRRRARTGRGAWSEALPARMRMRYTLLALARELALQQCTSV
jgi:hypothetical protein